MPVKRQSVKVLRFWYRMSLLPEVRALSHAARWWLYGVILEWTGFNNGVIEFTRQRHGAMYGLGDSRVFARARRDVLKTGLVEITRDGGSNLPALYFLTRTIRQASPPGAWVTTSPNGARNAWVTTTPNGEENRVTTSPKLGDHVTQENRPVLKNARASECRNAISNSHDPLSTESHSHTLATSEACQGGDAPGNGASIPPLASRH
jgi:hypothetical protein